MARLYHMLFLGQRGLQLDVSFLMNASLIRVSIGFLVRFCSDGRDAWSLLLFGLSYCLVYFFGSSVSLLCGCRFFFGSGPVWNLVVQLVKLSLNNSSRVFNSFTRFVI